MNNGNNMSYSVPFRCRDYADYKRAVEVMEFLNRLNEDFPISCVVGSGPKDPKDNGVRYLDVQCNSQAKIQHFQELGSILDKDIMELEKTFKLDEMGNPPEGASKLPPGVKPIDIFAMLDKLEQDLRNSRAQSYGDEGLA